VVQTDFAKRNDFPPGRLSGINQSCKVNRVLETFRVLDFYLSGLEYRTVFSKAIYAFWIVYTWYQLQLLFVKEAPQLRAQIRVRLRAFLMKSGHYEMASQEIRDGVERAHNTKKFGLEFKLRHDLARCFKELGQEQEAVLERQRAWDCLQNLVRGKRFDEAERGYEQAIKIFGNGSVTQAKLALNAAKAYFEIVEPEQALRWAQRAIEYSNNDATRAQDDKVLPAALLIAAMCCNNLQRGAEAEAFALRAVEALQTSDNAKQKSEAWANLASSRKRLGQLDQAQGDAHQALKFNPQSALANAVLCNCLVALGRERVKSQDLDTACELFERALSLPIWDNPQQALFHVQVLVHQSHAHYEAGRPAQCVRYAKAAIALKPSGKLRFSARTMAAVGHGTQGHLQEALAHRQMAYDLALIEGDNEQIASQMVGLAIDRFKRGRLDESFALCERALGLNACNELALTQQADIRRVQGRIEEARQIHLQRLENFGGDAAKARQHALALMGLAWLEADDGNAVLAWQHLQTARATFAKGTRIDAWCEVTSAWILALMGQNEDAHRVLERVEEIASKFSEDRETQLNACLFGGRAALVLKDFNRARELHERYIALHPTPVYEPTAYWGLGEALLGLGQREAAIEAYSRAANAGFQTRYTQAAQQRLRELQEKQ